MAYPRSAILCAAEKRISRIGYTLFQTLAHRKELQLKQVLGEEEQGKFVSSKTLKASGNGVMYNLVNNTKV